MFSFLSTASTYKKEKQIKWTKQLGLHGGVIIIGSLLWDNSNIRSKWHENDLNLSEKQLVPLPIRYRRVSSSRHSTYTMVFSNDISPGKMGKGYVVPFKKNLINSISELRCKACQMIRAEKNEKDYKGSFNWSWGVLGLITNPESEKEESKYEQIKIVKDEWVNSLNPKFEGSKYRLNDVEPFISNNGLLIFN